MKWRWFIFLLAPVFAVGIASAHTGDVYFAREGKPTVDGKLGDWPEDAWVEASHYTEKLGKPDGPQDFKVHYAVMWKGDRIYVAAKVQDDIHRCTRKGNNIHEDDHVGFSFVPSHARDLWYGSTSWMYGLSSETGKVEIGPSGRFGRKPGGLTYVAQKVVRDRKKGITRYEAEAAVLPPESYVEGRVPPRPLLLHILPRNR